MAFLSSVLYHTSVPLPPSDLHRPSCSLLLLQLFGGSGWSGGKNTMSSLTLGYTGFMEQTGSGG